MPERSTIFQGVQVGVEVTPGVAVAANKKLGALSITPKPHVEVQTFRPMGSKFPTTSWPGKDWTEAALAGQASYNELAYLFNSLLLAATPASLGGAPIAYQHTFTPTQSGSDTPKTYTIQQGDGRAGQFDFGLITAAGLTFTRDAVTIDGNMIGQEYTDGITITGAPTVITPVVIQPNQVSVYSDTTSAAIGTTKLFRVLEAEWRVENRWGPAWVVDAANASWVASVELEPNATLRLLVEADVNGMAWFARARDGATRFVRIEAIGSVISGANNNRLRLDGSYKTQEVHDFSDQNGIYAIEFLLKASYDAGWAKSITADLVTDLAAI